MCTRKHRNLLTRELDKKEVQEGLMKAVDVIDLIIEILRGSQKSAAGKRLPDNGDYGGNPF